VQLYSFLSQIMPWCDEDLERLYSFGKFVLPLLPTGRDSKGVSLANDVALEYYRLARVWSGAISLREDKEAYVKSPTDVGTRRATEIEAPLSELIKALNDKFGTEFSEDERYFAMQFCERASKDERVIKTANANSLDKFQLGIKDLLADFMIEAMGDNDEFVTKYMSNSAFQSEAFPILAKVIFDSVRERKSTTGR
jgi:type I restriction enzyme R subunit